MFTFLLVIHAIVAASLVAVILMQRSEGGGLGMGGSPSGLMSARGAADFLTRATTILATIFVVMSIGLATYAGMQRASRPIDTSLARPAGTPVPGDAVPLGDPLAGAAATVAGNVSAPGLPATAPVTAATPAPAAAEPAGKAVERAAAKTAAPRVIERESAVPTKLRLPASPTPATTSPLPAPKADSTPNTPSTTTPAPASAPAGGNNSVPLAQ